MTPIWYLPGANEFIQHDITYTTALKDFELMKDTPYLTLIVKLWGACQEYFGEKWQTNEES